MVTHPHEPSETFAGAGETDRHIREKWFLLRRPTQPNFVASAPGGSPRLHNMNPRNQREACRLLPVAVLTLFVGSCSLIGRPDDLRLESVQALAPRTERKDDEALDIRNRRPLLRITFSSKIDLWAATRRFEYVLMVRSYACNGLSRTANVDGDPDVYEKGWAIVPERPEPASLRSADGRYRYDVYILPRPAGEEDRSYDFFRRPQDICMTVVAGSYVGLHFETSDLVVSRNRIARALAQIDNRDNVRHAAETIPGRAK